MAIISADAGGVAADLAAIDPGLKVRFAENGNPPFWVVYHETEQPDGSTCQELVTTAEAYQTNSGVWEGLDQRIVTRIREIDSESRSGYNYADELEKAERSRHAKARADFAERIGDTAERAAAAVRKDLGSRYRGRAFIPRDI